MARILLVGYDPPPFCSGTKVEAAHYRTWQFLQPLVAAGHSVCLCSQSPAATSTRSLPGASADALTRASIGLGKTGWLRRLQHAHDTFAPDCVLSVNFDCCLHSTKLRTRKPMWMDVYGDYLTIIQAASYRNSSNRGVPTAASFMRRVLSRGDVFSVCGTPQKHMMVGELAMSGRLNGRTFGYEFVRVVPPGSPRAGNCRNALDRRGPLASEGISPEDFVVLWCGGYNTWTDVGTLFAALETAMAEENRLHFVSIGASTYSALGSVYDRFLAMAAGSRYRDRYHMLGWRPWQEIASYYAESDVGINVDAMHYETLYGTRTRLLEMISAGLPVVTSLGCELSHQLRDAGAALVFETGNGPGLARLLLMLARDSSLHQAVAERAHDCAEHDFSFRHTTEALLAWVEAPEVAPDRVPLFWRNRLAEQGHRGRNLLRQVMWTTCGLYRCR